MKRTSIYALAASLTVLGGAVAAQAQTSNVGVSLRAGIDFPTNSTTSSDFGSTWFGFGGEYRFLKLAPGTSAHPDLSLSLDYFSRNNLNETPIMLNYVMHEHALYGSLGAGISFDHAGGNTEAKFGYQLTVGYDLPITEVPLFVEAKFWGNEDSYYNAVGLYVGVRF